MAIYNTEAEWVREENDVKPRINIGAILICAAIGTVFAYCIMASL